MANTPQCKLDANARYNAKAYRGYNVLIKKASQGEVINYLDSCKAKGLPLGEVVANCIRKHKEEVLKEMGVTL